ncbi:unnamed protein product [Sphagnum troendelagicum]
MMGGGTQHHDEVLKDQWRMHTLFSVECLPYFDWQTVGLMHSFRKSGQPGPITRLLSCTEDVLSSYKGMDLAPTHLVPSMSHHPVTGDWYPAINKPAGVVHWLNYSEEAKHVDWVVILDADQILRYPLTPWEVGAERGKPVAARYGYLIGCDNELASLHTKHPEYCDKVGGFIVMHIDDLRVFAPLWLSKTEEVRADREHWSTNITGDVYGQGWISEMYGYSFGAAEVGLRHKIDDNLMIYPGYIPRRGVEPHVLHYGLPFTVGSWKFDKMEHRMDPIVYECNRLFTPPPSPTQAEEMESDTDKRRGLLLSIECVNTLNEGLMLHHEGHGCPKPPMSDYLVYLSSSARQKPKKPLPKPRGITPLHYYTPPGWYPKIHTLFSTECTSYFDWQTLGMIHSFKSSGQPGFITRLLSCTPEGLKTYKGMDLAPLTHVVPSMNIHPLTGDWYPAINKPAAVLHWLNHVQTDAEYLVILDADMIMRRPITPWEFGAERGRPVAAPYNYLIGCDNILAQLHTQHPEACDKVGGVIIIHIDDLRALAPLWLFKTEEVRADTEHWETKITGDTYGKGWISEMYGYSFGAAEIELRHNIRGDIMLYPGYIPNVEPCVLHYGLKFEIGDWHFSKAEWRDTDMTNICWKFFPKPPRLSSLGTELTDGERWKHNISIECVDTLNEALRLHHLKRGCQELDSRLETNIEAVKDNMFGRETVSTLPVADDDFSKRQSYQPPITHREDHVLESIGNNSHKIIQKSRTVMLKSIPVIISPQYWMVAAWTILVFFFLLAIYSLYSKRARTVQKQRHPRAKHARVHMRSDTNGRDTNGQYSGIQFSDSGK